MGEASTREYNGSSWSDGGDMEASMSSMIIAGTLTSAIYFGGYDDSLIYIVVTDTERTGS